VEDDYIRGYYEYVNLREWGDITLEEKIQELEERGWECDGKPFYGQMRGGSGHTWSNQKMRKFFEHPMHVPQVQITRRFLFVLYLLFVILPKWPPEFMPWSNEVGLVLFLTFIVMPYLWQVDANKKAVKGREEKFERDKELRQSFEARK